MATIYATDPIDFKIDQATGDLVFVDGRPEMTFGGEAVAQGILIRLRNIRGEWFANLDDGMPWFENDSVPGSDALLGQKFDEIKATAAFRAAILDTPGVASITRLAVTFDGATRTINATWSVATTFGDTIADTLTTGA